MANCLFLFQTKICNKLKEASQYFFNLFHHLHYTVVSTIVFYKNHLFIIATGIYYLMHLFFLVITYLKQKAAARLEIVIGIVDNMSEAAKAIFSAIESHNRYIFIYVRL